MKDLIERCGLFLIAMACGVTQAAPYTKFSVGTGKMRLLNSWVGKVFIAVEGYLGREVVLL